MAETSPQRSSLREFLASIATLKGDLSNITAPPFVLADKSTTEFPRYWVEQPSLFCAAAHASDPAERMLAVVKWFLASLRGQQYAGRSPGEGTKKPLNAFLGEVFTGECGPEDEPTRLVAEQVSHHPPVTACYLWNEKHGVRAEGYTRQEITFSGAVHIQQIGQALIHLDRWDEDYLIPLPDVSVKGLLTGAPYPELSGTHHLVSSSGFVADVDFSGKTMFGFGGKRNQVHAAVFRQEDSGRAKPLFTAGGSWSESFEIRDADGKNLDTYDVAAAQPSEFRTLPVEQQDVWESRRAWDGVIKALRAGDMQGVADSKSKLENGQRQLRKDPKTDEKAWEALFFTRTESLPTAEKLLATVGGKLQVDKTCGVWRFNADAVEKRQRPWRGDLTPLG